MSRPFFWSSLCLVICIGLVGCQSGEPDDGTPSPSPSENAATATIEPTPTNDAGVSITPTPGGIIFPTGPITLTIWTTEDFAPSDSDPGGRLLLDQLLEFDRNHPDVNLDVVTKRPTGPGGIMEYLHTARQVAPAVLPDITVLSSEMLPQATSEEALQPLDDLLPADLIEGLFPVAERLSRIDDRLVGVPFMVDFEHQVFNTTVLTDTNPNVWEAILDSGGPYLFPAADNTPVDSTLMHYLAAGGTLYDEEGAPHLEIDPLTEVFRFYQQGAADRVIPSSVLQLESLEDAWNVYRTGNALVAHVNTSAYLPARADLLNTAAAPVPGPRRPGVPLVSGWHWAIVTPDPSRQQTAAELISWLMDPDNLGAWSYSSQWLPASVGAYTAWPSDDEYVKFARDQILLGVARPDGEYYQIVQPALAQGIHDVLTGNEAPAAAAANSIP